MSERATRKEARAREDGRLSRVRALVQLGRYDEALAAVSQPLTAAPDTAEMLAERARVLRATGSFEAAREAIATLAEHRPDHPSLPQLRADLATASGDLSAAERICSDHVEAHPRDVRGLARWARSLTRLGRHDEASAALARGSEIDPASAAVIAGRVELLIAMGQFEQAEVALRSLRARHPTHVRLERLQAELTEAVGDPGAAERIRAADVAAHPHDVARRIRWVRSLTRLDRHAEALAAVVAGLESAPDSVELLVERASLLTASKQIPAARAVVRALAERRPSHPQLAQLRAKLADAAGDLDAAERLWADHVTAHPHEAAGRVRWCNCLARLGRHDAALAAISEGLKRAPDLPEFFAAQASLLVATGRFEAAEAGIRALSARSPDHPRLEPLRAELSDAAGDLDAAERVSAADCARHPEDAARRLRWAQHLARLDRHGDALDAVSDGLRTAPDDPELLVERASLLIATGRVEAAEEALAAVEVRHARHRRLPHLRARLAEAAGDLDAARRIYTADAAAFPEDADRRVRWLRHLQHSGRIAEALAALDERPSLLQAERQLRLDCLLESGRWEEASALLDAWPHRDARGQLVRLRGLMDLALMRLDHEGAMRNARAALDIAPRDHSAAQGLARAAACMFQTELAWRMLGQVRIRGTTGGGPPRRGVGRLRHLVGQMVNDFRLRPEATAELAAAARGDAETLIATAAAQMRADPASFGAALGLITGLARAGRLGTHEARHGTGSERIPAIIHQFWDKETAPPDIERLMRHAREVNPDCGHRRWDDAAAQRYLGDRGMVRALAAFRASRHPAMRSDIFRLAVLHGEGGLYLDADDYCARPLRSLIPRDAELVCYQENIGSIGNNFIAVRPGHPVIGAALTEGVGTVLEGASETLWLVTGPGLITRAVASAMAAMPGCAVPAGLRVVPLDVFRGTVHTLRKASYKADTRSWKRVG